jgi:hypothetical protein
MRPAATFTVEFAAGASRTGPVPFGMANMIRCVLKDRPEDISLSGVWDIPAGMSVEQITSAAATLIARHEALRTLVQLGPPHRQTALGRGCLAVPFYEAGGDCEIDAARIAQELVGVRFDLASEIPIRVALIGVAGRPVKLVVTVSHTAADASTVKILMAEWSALCAGEPLPPPCALQPIDVAKREQSSLGQQRAAAALTYWEDQLQRIPQATFALPDLAGSSSDAGQPGLRVRSVPAAAAIEAISRRTNTSRSGVLLAALLRVIGILTEQQTIAVWSLFANRIGPEAARHVGSLVQDALITVELGRDGFDAQVRRTRLSSLVAYKNSRFDADALWEIVRRVEHERGTRFARDLVLSDLGNISPSHLPPIGGTDEDSASDNRDTHFSWLPAKHLYAGIALWSYNLVGQVDLTLWIDPRLCSRDQARQIGAALIRLLLAAEKEDLPEQRIVYACDLAPLPRPGRWMRVDNCWVEVDAVRGLVRDALGGRPHMVDIDPAASPQIVCHTAADGDPPSPESLHSACHAALDGRLTAMTPQYYVVYDTAPREPDDAKSWRAARVLAHGDGRGSSA